MYSNISYVVKCDKGIGKHVLSHAGVKQGCVCSPTLFNIYLNDIGCYLTSSDSDVPIIDGVPVTHLLFADDLVLMSSSANGLQNSLNNLARYCSDWELSLNINKSKVIIFNSTSVVKDKHSFYFRDKTLDIVASYTYLGLTLTSNGSFKLAMVSLRSKALRAWFKLKQNIYAQLMIYQLRYFYACIMLSPSRLICMPLKFGDPRF